MEIDIKAAKADLKERQEAVVKELNEIATAKQKLAVREQELIILAHKLNGENDMLTRLSENGKKKPTKSAQQ
jgi:hypothetical protein